MEAKVIPLKFVWGIRCRLWAESDKLRDEGDKLRAESDKLWDEGDKLWDEGSKLWDEGSKLWDEGSKLWDEGILEVCGNIALRWEWGEGGEHRCVLETGEEFEYKPEQKEDLQGGG